MVVVILLVVVGGGVCLYCRSVSLRLSINQVSCVCEQGGIKGSIEL